MPEFDRWWNDPKKHCKRVDHWLPHWRALAERLADVRRIRYFTLCARSMIDIFMLVKEGILPVDLENGSIGSVSFCECDGDQFDEIREMIGREDAGFLGRLEDVALFVEDDFTGQFPSLDDIARKLEEEESLTEHEVERLKLKRTHINVRSSFPYDCVNLDFCQYYYSNPPGMTRINDTVRRILEWQALPNNPEVQSVDEFILTVTCRHDAQFPVEAENRLRNVIRENCARYAAYKAEFDRSRGLPIDEWSQQNHEDFFFAGWPKDIAAGARECGWKTEILDYVFYRRVNDVGNAYVIICLVLKFTKSKSHPDYLPAALRALDREGRILIDEIERKSKDGKRLLDDLTGIVAIRNEQAKQKRLQELPEP
jgi:hypothetical protein